MSATQVSVAPPTTRPSVRSLERPAPQVARWGRIRRFLRNLTKGELVIVPVTHKGEEIAAAAQRWPAPAIAALVVSAGGLLVSTVLTVSLALLMLYVNGNKDSSAQAIQNATNIEQLRGQNEILKANIAELTRDNTRLENDKRDIVHRLEKVEGLIGLKVANLP